MMNERSGLRLLDPTSAPRPVSFQPAPRPSTLDGKVVGLLNNGKPNADRLLARLHARLAERYRLAGVVHDGKPSTTRPAPEAVIETLAGRADVVITAVGD